MRTLFATMLIAAASSLALADSSDFQWQGQLKPGQLLEIRGIIGSIHAVGVSGGTASVTAKKTGKTSDPALVKIVTVPYEGGLVICAEYPTGADHPNTCNPPGKDNNLSANNNDVQVEFTVQVPQGVLFTAHTNHGDISALSLTADVQATTLIGSITISTSGAAEANTLEGSIMASIGSVNWKGTHHFDAGHGNLELQIPSGANVTIHAVAFRGAIMTDLPLKIMSTTHGQSSMADGTLGTGGRVLKLSTFGGNITLK